MPTGKQSIAWNHSRPNETAKCLYAIKKGFWDKDKWGRNSYFFNPRKIRSENKRI